MSEVEVLGGYRVTIPEGVRRRLRLRKGAKLLCELGGREIIFRAEHIPEAPTLRMLGLAAEIKANPEQAVLEEVEEKLVRDSSVSRR